MSVYSVAFAQVVLPLRDSVRGRSYARNRSLLWKSQWWSYQELRAFQWRELRKLLECAFNFVPYYQRKYAEAGARLGDIRTWDDFAKLPTLTRQEVNANRSELCSTSFRGKLLPYATGGSSGVPTRFYRTYESYDWRTAARDRVYSWAGLMQGERAAYLWGAPVGKVSRKARWTEAVSNLLQRRLVLNTFTQNEKLWTEVYHRIWSFRPGTVVGYVSSLSAFSEFLRERKWKLPELRGVIAAAEPLFSDTRAAITAAFRAPVFNTYGSREFMSMAGECEQQDGLHINAENLLVETAEAGLPSSIYVTDLHNYGMPFIRYEIGDLGMLVTETCTCGRGLPRLTTIEGRVLDALRTADGRVVPGEFFPHLLKDIPEIREYQVVQKTLGQIEIAAVISERVSEGSLALLRSEIGKAFGGQIDWQIKPVDQIPRRQSGKQRITVGLQ
jgi:phenylacetate-CoA ligase